MMMKHPDHCLNQLYTQQERFNLLYSPWMKTRAQSLMDTPSSADRASMSIRGSAPSTQLSSTCAHALTTHGEQRTEEKPLMLGRKVIQMVHVSQLEEGGWHMIQAKPHSLPLTLAPSSPSSPSCCQISHQSHLHPGLQQPPMAPLVQPIPFAQPRAAACLHSHPSHKVSISQGIALCGTTTYVIADNVREHLSFPISRLHVLSPDGWM